MLTSKAGPRQGRGIDTQKTQLANTMQDSLEPPTPLTATRKQSLLMDRNSVGYETLRRQMLNRDISPPLLRTNTSKGHVHRDSMDSVDQYRTPSPTGRPHHDSLDSGASSVATRYVGKQQHQPLVTKHGYSEFTEEDLPANNPAIAKHPEKRRITIGTKSMNKDEISASINASLPTNGELVDESNRPLTNEEVHDLVNNHPGFRIQIWGENWESVASTSKELADKVQTEAVHWFHGIAQLQQASVCRENRIELLLSQLKDSQDSYNAEHSKVVKLCQKIDDQDTEINEMDKVVQASIADNDRLRKIRANDRQLLAQVSTKVKQLENELRQLRGNQMHPGDFNRSISPINQDPKVLQTRSRLVNLPEVQQRVSLGNQGPVFSDFMQDRVKDAYPMPKTFTGEDDVSYDWWKGKVVTYLNHNTRSFNTEWKCIELIRGRTSGLAFTLIKARAAVDSPNKYTQIDELFADLDAEFKPYDEEIAAQTKISAESTKMQPGETFNKFIARFNVIMGPLLYNRDTQKITWLLNALLPNAELYRVALTNQRGHTYQTLVTFLRDICSRDLGEHYIIPIHKYRAREAKPTGKKELVRGKQAKPDDKETRPPLLYRQLLKEKRCLDCGKTGHRSDDADKPCKGKPRVPDSKLIAISNFEQQHEHEHDRDCDHDYEHEHDEEDNASIIDDSENY
jgi:hypothetical protein